MQPRSAAAVTFAVILTAAACSNSSGSSEAGSGTVVTTTTVPDAIAVVEAGGADSGPSGEALPDPSDRAATGEGPRSEPIEQDRQLSPLADQVRSAGDLRFDPSAARLDRGPLPVGLTVPGLDLADAPIRDVGVEPNGEMEIPGASEIGWYRWSASPGQAGSSVLAAHIAFNGRDGVFRELDEVVVGDRFTVHYDDGSTRDFEVTELGQYAKQALPFDRVFAKTGEPSVVLITCGGDFNRCLNSYEDNVVVYADPV